MVVYVLLTVSSLTVTYFIYKSLRLNLADTQRPASIAKALDNVDLPSVSVCIAARNEMHALTQNLEAVLASNYKKMEILVLDDSSTDDTSLIIKSFAHAGVRFIAGNDLPAGWLGRNYAYQTLAHEASGEIVMFLDVDTIIGVATISQLIDQLYRQKVSMISVLPKRDDGRRLSALFGTLRYMWEFVVAHDKRPESSGALWIIDRPRLMSLKSAFYKYRSSVRPEAHLAAQLNSVNEYSHLVATLDVAVRYEKRWHSQLETAERLYYPLFGRSAGRVAGIFVLLVGLLIPYAAIVANVNSADNVTLIWSILLIAASWSVYARFTYATYAKRSRYLRLALWPYLCLQELALYILSLGRYATATVRWKGRPVQGLESIENSR